MLAENPRFLDATIYDNAAICSPPIARPARGAAAAEPAARHAPRTRSTAIASPSCSRSSQSGERYGALVLHTAIAPLVMRVHHYLWDLFWLIVGVITASLMLAWALERMVYAAPARASPTSRAHRPARGLHVARQGLRRRRDWPLGRARSTGCSPRSPTGKSRRARRCGCATSSSRSPSHELKTPLTSLKLQLQALIESAAASPIRADAERAARRLRAGRAPGAPARAADRQTCSTSRASPSGRLRCSARRSTSSRMVARRGRRSSRAEAAARRLHADARRCRRRCRAAGTRCASSRCRQPAVATRIKYGAGKPIEVAVQADDDEATLARARPRHRHRRARPGAHLRALRARRVGATTAGSASGSTSRAQIVTAHGGTISVDSERGHGATFTVVLPRGFRAVAEAGQAWTHA